MRTINTASGMTSLLLGRLGENERTQFVFDVADWLEEYPAATITLYFQKPHSSESYPVVISQPVNGKVTWTVADSELQETGYGKCELVAVQGETVVKGHIWKTNVLDSLDGAGDAPDPWDSWMTEFTRLKGEAEDAAEDAAESAEDAAEAAAAAAQEAVQEMIDDTAGDGDTDKVWSADKLADEFDSLQDEVDQKYEKPATGIPASDMAAGVIPDISGKADKANPVFSGSNFSFNRKSNTTLGNGGSATFGWNNEASGMYSFATGYSTKASNTYASSEGAGTTASGDASHAEGSYTQATGSYSHAEGQWSKASGLTSHAEGNETQATAWGSHAEGTGTIAAGQNQHVSGKYNVADENDTYAEIIGNGNASSKANARTLDWNGNERLAGDLYVGCNDDSTGGTKVAKITDIPDVSGFYTKPVSGIPASDLASGVIPSVPVQDVQINGTSILSDGVANIIMNPVQNVSGTTPTINAESGYRYICGECSTLTIVAPASGCIDVTFQSGTTPTVLSVSSAKTGVIAIKWANGFDPTSLDADTTYEINILDGEFGVVGSWT